MPYSILIQYSRNIQHSSRAQTSSILHNFLAKLTRRPPNKVDFVPVALYLVPKRHFGQGKRIPIFGHAPIKSSTKWPNFTPLIGLFVFCYCSLFIVDLGKLKDKYGLDPLPLLRQAIHNLGDISSEQTKRVRRDFDENYVDPGFQAAMLENKADVHKVMMKEALERYNKEVLKIAENDPEIKALLDGVDESQIKVENQEVFQMKKEWIREYMAALKHHQEDDKEGAQVKESLLNKYGIDSHWKSFKSLSAEADDFSDGDFDSGQVLTSWKFWMQK